MRETFNFARRPFRDDRPAYAVAGLLLLVGAVLMTINVRMFADYRRQVADTRSEIASLETRGRTAEERTQAARAALSSYKVSTLAEESRGLARIVAERRFSWTTLLGRLERTLPAEVGLVRLQPRFGQDEEVEIEMQFFAKDKEAIVRTIAALSKDPVFGHVQVRSESQPESGSEPIEFLLSSRYEVAHPAPEASPAGPSR